MALLLAALPILRCESAVATETRVAAISSIEIGMNGCFKVGCWTPVKAKVEISDGLKEPRIDVVVADNDGVPTRASALVQRAKSLIGSAEVVVFTKVGRIGSPIRVLLSDGNQILDERTIRTNSATLRDGSAIGLPATAELLVAYGSHPFGLATAFPDRDADGSQLARRVVEINRTDALPSEWFGYEAVDVLLVSAGDGTLCRQLAADGKRFAALERWVELGGRMVVFCDGQSASEMLSIGGPLAKFAPGKFTEVFRLRDTGALERFAGTTSTIPLSTREEIRIPRFRDVHANVEAFAEQQASGLPVVTRAVYGLGEVAFVGVDFGHSPLNEWPGRSPFLQALLRPYLANINAADASQRLVTRGYNDLNGALRQQLGQSFVGVVPLGFGVVALFAIAYMVFLGPIDFLLVNRWIRRSVIAWVSFPLAVVAFCGGAAWLADWGKGGEQLRANKLELVDVDVLSGRARGTYWSALYSPHSSELNLSFIGAMHSGGSPKIGDSLISWWGLPGAGIGGMQAGGVELGSGSNGYRYGSDYNSLEGVPILASGSKSVTARWTAQSSLQVEAELADEGGLAVGRFTNRTGTTLNNVRLLYGTWAYRLGTVRNGQQVQVSEQLNPRKVKTIVTRDAFGDDGPLEGRVFVSEHVGAKEILNLMMFYEAAGGFSFAHLPNRFQAFCDLSRMLELGRAVLVAEASGPGSTLSAGTSDISSDAAEKTSSVVFRFLLPVNRTANSASK
jgi:hypothetical protein